MTSRHQATPRTRVAGADPPIPPKGPSPLRPRPDGQRPSPHWKAAKSVRSATPPCHTRSPHLPASNEPISGCGRHGRSAPTAQCSLNKREAKTYHESVTDPIAEPNPAESAPPSGLAHHHAAPRSPAVAHHLDPVYGMSRIPMRICCPVGESMLSPDPPKAVVLLLWPGRLAILPCLRETHNILATPVGSPRPSPCNTPSHIA